MRTLLVSIGTLVPMKQGLSVYAAAFLSHPTPYYGLSPKSFSPGMFIFTR
jgi:hypothetical protein